MEPTERNPENPDSRGGVRLRTAAALGGLMFALAVASFGMLPEPASAPAIDHDLDFPFGKADWLGTRDAARSRLFAGDPSFRSEWVHDDGWVVSVFAYTLLPDDQLDGLRGDFRAGEEVDGGLVLIDDTKIPEPFLGFRLIEQRIDDDGMPYTMVHYFVHDPLGQDIHQLVSIVDLNEVEYADAELRALIASAVWVEAALPSS